MFVFLSLNGIELEYSQEDLCTTILNVASGKYDFDDILKWILQHKYKTVGQSLPSFYPNICPCTSFFCAVFCINFLSAKAFRTLFPVPVQH